MDDLLQEVAVEKERIEDTLAAMAKTLRRKRRGLWNWPRWQPVSTIVTAAWKICLSAS